MDKEQARDRKNNGNISGSAHGWQWMEMGPWKLGTD